MIPNQLVNELRESAEAAWEAWDEYEHGRLARLIVQVRMDLLSEVLGQIERHESLD